MKTLDEAAAMLCPQARMFGMKEVAPYCHGDKCMAWRWVEMGSTPEWRAAVKAEAARIGENIPYPKASRAAADDPAAHGLVPSRGFCGLAGKP